MCHVSMGLRYWHFENTIETIETIETSFAESSFMVRIDFDPKIIEII